MVSKDSSHNYSTDRSVLKFESPEEARSLEENQVLGAIIHVLFQGRMSSTEQLTEYNISEPLDMDPLICLLKVERDRAPRQGLPGLGARIEEKTPHYRERLRRLCISDRGGRRHLVCAP
jgi:hypothetical protein